MHTKTIHTSDDSGSHMPQPGLLPKTSCVLRDSVKCKECHFDRFLDTEEECFRRKIGLDYVGDLYVYPAPTLYEFTKLRLSGGHYQRTKQKFTVVCHWSSW